MSTPTPTPRTDGSLVWPITNRGIVKTDSGILAEDGAFVFAFFARTLERELAAAHAEVRNKNDTAQEFLARAEQAEFDAAALRKALEPFAKASARWEDCEDSERLEIVWKPHTLADCTVSDLRRAARALKGQP